MISAGILELQLAVIVAVSIYTFSLAALFSFGIWVLSRFFERSWRVSFFRPLILFLIILLNTTWPFFGVDVQLLTATGMSLFAAAMVLTLLWMILWYVREMWGNGVKKNEVVVQTQYEQLSAAAAKQRWWIDALVHIIGNALVVTIQVLPLLLLSLFPVEAPRLIWTLLFLLVGIVALCVLVVELPKSLLREWGYYLPILQSPMVQALRGTPYLKNTHYEIFFWGVVGLLAIATREPLAVVITIASVSFSVFLLRPTHPTALRKRG